MSPETHNILETFGRVAFHCHKRPWLSRSGSLLDNVAGERSADPDGRLRGTLSALGRGERHGGIRRENLKHIVKVHKVIAKKGTKMAASVATECENEMMKKGVKQASKDIQELPRTPRSFHDLLKSFQRFALAFKSFETCSKTSMI